jgi:hypothetical protein
MDISGSDRRASRRRRNAGQQEPAREACDVTPDGSAILLGLIERMTIASSVVDDQRHVGIGGLADRFAVVEACVHRDEVERHALAFPRHKCPSDA